MAPEIWVGLGRNTGNCDRGRKDHRLQAHLGTPLRTVLQMWQTIRGAHSPPHVGLKAC